jgi:hypothetical protein
MGHLQQILSDRATRIAYVPEPSTDLMAVRACGLMWWTRKSFKRLA